MKAAASDPEISAMRTAIANLMRIQRTIKSWSQDDLVQNTGLSRSTIQRLENELATMDIRQLLALSTAFGMHWFAFMELVNSEIEGAR